MIPGAGGGEDRVRFVEVVSVVVTALLTTGTAAGISLFALDGMPHVVDEQAYFFQARLMARGSLRLPAPPEPRLFEIQHILIDEGGWRSVYPPGWPALLALGVLLGAPWLVNPVLLGLGVVGVWWLGRILFDRETGVVAALLLGGSTFALMAGADMMSHPATLVLSVLALVLLARADRAAEGSGSWFVAGLVAGACLLIRPFTALLLLGPVACCFILRAARRRRVLGLLIAGALPGVLLLLLYNELQFGLPIRGGHAAEYPDFSFTGRAGVHVPLPEILKHHSPWYWDRLNRNLWNFPFPDLLILLPLLLPARRRALDWILLAGATALVFGYCGYFYRSFRFVFEALAPLSILGARSIQRLRRLFSPHGDSATLRGPLLSFAVGFLLLAWPLSTVLPERAKARGHWFHGVSSLPRDSMESAGVGSSALVLVAGTGSAYGSLFPYQELPPATAERVFVRDVPELRAAAEELYPRDEVWRATIRLEPLPGSRPYPSRNRLQTLRWRQIR